MNALACVVLLMNLGLPVDALLQGTLARMNQTADFLLSSEAEGDRPVFDEKADDEMNAEDQMPPTRVLRRGASVLQFSDEGAEEVQEVVKRTGRTTVWVHGFSRSGSSTMLSMFTEAWPEMVQGNAASVFSLFEPCSEGDELSPDLSAGGCADLLGDIGKCDFSRIRKLNGWYDTHSLVSGITFKQYSSSAAAGACEEASLLAFKTISHVEQPVSIQYRLDTLLNNPSFLMLDIIRDPRSIYSSVMNTYPFNLKTKRDVSFLLDICDTFALGIDVTHDRIHRVVFEEFVQKPMEVMRAAYNFIGADFGALQLQWILAHINAKSCPDQVKYPWKIKYSDCSMDSKASLSSFRSVLNAVEMQLFVSHPACERVAQAYGYV